jgi:hypothetical protein
LKTLNGFHHIALCIILVAAPANFAAVAADAVTNAAPAPPLSDAEQKVLQEARAAREAAAKLAAEKAAQEAKIAAEAAAAKKAMAAKEAAEKAAMFAQLMIGARIQTDDFEDMPEAMPASRTNSPSAKGDVLQFLDGAVLHGALKGVDVARGLRWEHPDAKAPFDLMPADLDFLRLNQAKSMALASSCHVRFAGGDDLFGSLVSLDADTLQFNTWFGGALKIPRAALQTITFLPKDFSLVYEGPTDSSDWVVGGGTQNGSIRIGGGLNNVQQVIVINGQVVVVNSGNASRNGPPGPTNWTWQDGSFVTAAPGTLGRNFNLSGSSTIEFDLSCNGPFSLWLGLYSSSLDRINTGNSIVVALSTGQITLLRANQPRDAFSSTPTTLTNLDPQAKPARFTLQCNQDEGSLAALLDGVEVRRWTGLGSFNGLGTGFVVQNQSAGSLVKLSHIRVSKWSGKYEPDLAPASATNSDTALFVNRDQAGGKVQAIADGRLDMALNGSVLHIPLERLRQIDFAKSDAVPEPRGPWEVRARFLGGGNVSFQLEKWDAKSVAGHSALFGPVAFQPGSIYEMQFSLDSPRTALPFPPSASSPSGTDPNSILDFDYDTLDP